MSDKINQLEQAIKLSDRILSEIEKESWEIITLLDEERLTLIEQYFNQNSSKSIDAKLTRLLKQKNDQIVSQLSQIQQQIRSKQIQLNQSKKVSKAYLENI